LALRGCLVKLMPRPSEATVGSGSLVVAGSFAIEHIGRRGALIDQAIARFQSDLYKLSGIRLNSFGGPSMRVECLSDELGAEPLSADESYDLVVSSSDLRLSATSPIGILRALATLRQLIEVASGSLIIPCVRIADSPRFGWRGLMIDTARHFMSANSIKRQISAMECVKLNVLHLHLSDNEGFRVECNSYPKLTAIASHGQYYTQAEIRDLVTYASERGITIVPEFDMPGHVLAILTAYPELAAKPVDFANPLVKIQNALNPASDATYAFAKAILQEMATLFPGRHFHVGGDEVVAAAWEGQRDIELFKRRHQLTAKVELEAYFHRFLHGVLKSCGKTMLGWEEIADASIADDVVVQVWRTSNATAHATAKGVSVIVSAGYYQDWLWPASTYYRVDPYDSSLAYTAAAEPFAELRKNPRFSGLPADAWVAEELPPLSDAQRELVLGGEAALWSEIVSDEMLDGRIWPGAAAIAERFWSSETTRDTSDMYWRLIRTQDQLRVLGLNDDANRRRMAARLAPGDSAPILTMLEAVAPVRNMAHTHALLAVIRGEQAREQHLNSIADMASADSLVACRFALEVATYLRGEEANVSWITSKLTEWVNNEILFAAIAQGRPVLEQAVPVAKDIAELATIGLRAVAALEDQAVLLTELISKAAITFGRHLAARQASADLATSFLSKQPPADLLVVIAQPVQALLEAAAQPKSSSTATHLRLQQ
jgi:hexosaminidase